MFFIALSFKTITAYGTDLLVSHTPLSSFVTDILAIIIFICLLVLIVLVNFGLTKTTKYLLNSEPTQDAKTTIISTTKYLLPSLAIGILVSIILLFGGMLFVIPGIIFFVWYYFSITSIIIDDKKGIESLKYSKSLVVGRWWEMFFRILIPKFVFSILIILLLKILLLFINLLPQYNITVAIFIDYAITALTIPLILAPDIILYENAKSTKPTGLV
jgi:hypothetical protein